MDNNQFTLYINDTNSRKILATPSPRLSEIQGLPQRTSVIEKVPFYIEVLLKFSQNKAVLTKVIFSGCAMVSCSCCHNGSLSSSGPVQFNILRDRQLMALR